MSVSRHRAPGRTRRRVIAVVLVVATAISVVLALALGSYEIPVIDVLRILGGDDSVRGAKVVLDWRMPRALAAVLFGAALAASGAIFQGLTRNPLASPEIIGFSTGAYTGAIVVIVVIGEAFARTVAAAIVGGLLTALVVYLLAYRNGISPFRLIIVGIGVSALLASVNTWLLLKADQETAAAATVWGAGRLDSLTWERLALAAALIAALLLALAMLTPHLHQLELGDALARSLGTNLEITRVALIAVGVALTAVVTAVAGPISFIALAAPQIARRLIGTGGLPIAGSCLVGATLLSVADVIGAHALPNAVPVGIVTVVIGGGYLAWLLVHEGRARRGVPGRKA